MRLVLDTDVMVAAIRSDTGASQRLLVAAFEQRYRLLVSTPLIIEYQAVMTRSQHLKASRLTADEVTKLLDAVATVSTPVKLEFLWRPALRDPDDDMVLETAVNGAAELLVTFNRGDFAVGAERFELEVVSPGAALQRIGG